MITEQLLNPKSIAVIGASNDIYKPGGKLLKNLIDGNYEGLLCAVNPKADEIQEIKSYKIEDLPNVDLAIIAIAAKYVPDTAEYLVKHKNTKAFIVISAGFSEENLEGAIYEKRLVEIINSVNGSLIGPNCTGVLTPNYHGIFTLPIPKLTPKGCDFISGSGATACFILESGIAKGLIFSRVFTVGNSAQMGVEEILEYMDNSFDPEKDSKIKLLYIENIAKPKKLMKHAASLINKGCKIAAVKAGSSEAGSRAASSHTGALASPDSAVDALFQKAGIVRCSGREELTAVASVFMHPEIKGKNVAVITHAGGPGVMLTDALSKGGMNVPLIEGDDAKSLLSELFPGSSVANPIDFLATGTAEQLGTIIDYVERKFSNIDAMAVIFGTPGLTKIFDVYELLDKKIKKCSKPLFPVLPSGLTAKEETEYFVNKGRVYFSDETTLGNAMTKVFNTPKPQTSNVKLPQINTEKIRTIIENCNNGYISPEKVQALFDAAEIPRVREFVCKTEEEALSAINTTGFPVVMKVIGPIHKSDVGGVVLNISNSEDLTKEFRRMIKIKDTTSVLIQPMLTGTELFIGAKREDKFGHMVLCGLGGIFIEVLKDVSSALSPVTLDDSKKMIKNLKGYKIIQGVRGQAGVNEKLYVEIISKVSALVEAAPEIAEMDINPLLGTPEKISAVDGRIRIEK